MKKKMNIRFMIISAAAIIITAVISTVLFYIVLQEQVFSDLKAYIGYWPARLLHQPKQSCSPILDQESGLGWFHQA